MPVTRPVLRRAVLRIRSINDFSGAGKLLTIRRVIMSRPPLTILLPGICPVGQPNYPVLGNHTFVPVCVDRGNQVWYGLPVIHEYLWPNQVPQPESVAAN